MNGGGAMNLKIIKNNLLITGTVIATIIYLAWRIFFTIPLKDGIISLISGVVLLIVEILGMFEAVEHYHSMANIQYPICPNVKEEDFLDVDVFIATYNEPYELLYKTINGCINMDYPDKSKVHIYLCDDGNRAEMKELANHMHINYITRTDRKYAKAGNLNNALKNSKSPLVVTFDADMIPMHDFLTACVPYFFTKEKVGFIQTPQSFYNPDLFQYYLFSESRIPNEQDYFYRDIQISRNKSNSVIYGGSNTVILRKALEEASGFYTKSITEDFATGLIVQSKGYKCYAVNEVHASGLSPSDLKSLIKQRDRWARGCIQTGRRLNILFRKGLSFEQKISYISAIYYWYAGIKRFVYIMAPILFSVFGIVVVKCNLFQVLIFWLPMYLLNDASLKHLSRNIRTTKWTNIYETILFPSLIIPVMLETFGISKNKFSVTKKEGAFNDKNYQMKKAIPHIFFAILSVIGISNCTRMIFTSNSPAYSVILFWLIINFYNILMALFFMLGRKSFRKAERFLAEVDCILEFDGNKIRCITHDISESGVAAVLESPMYIPYDKLIKISLNTERYSCELKGQVVQVSKIEDHWKYSFKLIDVDENNFKNLLSITYDREPSLPKNLDENSSIFDDIRVNILTRNKKKILFNRKLPRIQLKKLLISNEGIEVKVTSFNYEYFGIRIQGLNEPAKNLIIPINENIVLHCLLERKVHYDITNKNKGAIGLYKILNFRDIVYNEDFKHILEKWILEYSDKKKDYIKSKKMPPADELDEMSYL